MTLVSLNSRLKDLVGLVTRLKKKKKKTSESECQKTSAHAVRPTKEDTVESCAPKCTPARTLSGVQG